MKRSPSESGRVARSCVLPIKGQALRLAREGRAILDGVDVTLGAKPGITVLVGPNGAGKSVLARVLAGLLPPDGGCVTWAGSPPDLARQRHLGVVFQHPVLLHRSTQANIEFAFALAGVPKAERRERAREYLGLGSLLPHASTPAHQLSGGEQQRLAFVRTLALEPAILILDEPAASLDPSSTAALEHLIGAAKLDGHPILLITHDLAQARRLADDVIFMHMGNIRERTPAQNFFAQPQTPQASAFLKGEIVL